MDSVKFRSSLVPAATRDLVKKKHFLQRVPIKINTFARLALYNGFMDKMLGE